MANKVVEENLKQGNPISEWGIDGDGDANIQGFATEISTNVGQTVDFKIATDSTNYRIEIYRLGYYGGDGARKVATIDKNLTTAQIQPHPIVDYTTGLIDCGNWAVSASWQIPADAVSGVYIAKLVREDGTEGASHIPFIVREDGSTSDVVFQTSDTTWQAYNAWGGASLYVGNVPTDPADMIAWMPPNCSCGLTAIGRATKVSYNRPFITNTSPMGGTHDFIFGAEHSAIRWLEQNGYDVSYISGVDATRSGAQLLNHKAYLSVGHDEYWSAEQRANVEAARDSGVNLAFWSGNEIYWKVRWEDSIDGNGTPYRTMVTYKSTWSGVDLDPSDTSTGTWRDPRFRDPGQEPENSLTGTMFSVDSYRLDTITVGYDFSNLRFWRNTEIAELEPGETHELVKNLLGYEWDSDVENGFRPAGLINMSSTTVAVEQYLRDYGTTIGAADATHSLTMYRAESGALVFGAGTVFWSWGLDDQHEGERTPTDPNVQQAMVNMFADMGIQPATLQASLVLATQSTDFAKPTSTITSPILGAAFVEGQRVTISGTAVDFGGGVIAGVEVSTDGGQSWWKATGRENWTYSWIAQASGNYTIMSRAVDDSLNLETAGPGRTVSVSLPSTSSLWTYASKPTNETVLDRNGVEVGVRFQSSIGGEIEAIKFYKGFYNIGPHSVSLWTNTGELLATATSVGETLSGWQTVQFSQPIQIQAGVSYVASYHTNGYYSVDNNYFASGRSVGPLTVQAGGGLYDYTATPGVFPTRSYQNGNYWVDVVFDAGPNDAPVASDDFGFAINRNGTLSLSFAALTGNDTDLNGDSLSILSVGGAQNGTVSLNEQTGRVIFTPTLGYTGSASFSYVVTDGRGGTDSAVVNLVVEEGPQGVSLFSETSGPTTQQSYNDNRPIELGMKFAVTGSGTITGIRFYKAAGDTGTHTGSLWTASGQLLTTVNFTSESLSGWQVATFATPIQVSAGNTYVASYNTTGSYVATGGYFNNTVSNGPLTAPSSSISGGNGVYAYSAGGLFPTATYNSSNYWVDVVYNQTTTNSAPTANNDNDIAATRNTALSLSTATLLANDNDPDNDVLTVTSVGDAVNGTVLLDAINGAITFTPSANHMGAASFTYAISDGRGGTSTATVNLLVSQPETAVSLFPSSSRPVTAAVNDPGSVELGMRFTSSVAGTITGVRFYKSAQDTGVHTGSLWTAGGTLLTTATFSSETTSGWQTVRFAEPITIAAGQTYVASYHSNGNYAVSSNYFTAPVTNGPLSTASGANGVYAYGPTTRFPNATYNNTNYWVDVLFEPATENAAPVAANDDGYFTNYNTPLVLQADVLLDNDEDLDADPLVISGVGNAQNGLVSFDSVANTVTFTPTEGFSGTAGFSYTISDGKGGFDTADVSFTVKAQDTAQHLFGTNDVPTTVRVNDQSPVELGMKFQSDVAGWVTGIRFYKGPLNTGTHTGSLWTASGTLLGTVTFTGETASGWQTATLAQEVEIAANTTYVVSYHTNGNYSATSNGFANSITRDHLTALSSAVSGGNGVYAYGPGGVFPTNSYNNTNYYVDVAFRPQLAA